VIASKRFIWLLPLLLLTLVLAGCGNTPTQVAEQEGGFLLALPRITVDIDSQGNLSIAGVTADTLKTLTFGQVDITGMRVDPAYVTWFTDTNLQHVEVVHKNDGLFLFANNEPLPHVGWSSDSLSATGDLIGDFNLLDARTTRLVKLAIPFMQRIGLDVAIRFPKQASSDEIALRDPGEAIAAMNSESAGGIAQLRVHVDYDGEGVPSVLSVSTQDLEEALGASLRQLQLDPNTISMLMGVGVQHVTIRTTGNGLLLWVNGQPLPHLAWSDDLLSNGADLYGQLYYTEVYQLSREAATNLLPLLNDIDGEVVLRFPLSAGAQAIPLPNP